jgi:isoleucyl-tRNA synthetase
MKAVKAFVEAMDATAIETFEAAGSLTFEDQGQQVSIELIDCEVMTEDIPGMLVATGDGLTVALDATLTEELKNEGLARELVNRVQNLRKSSGLEVVDRIDIEIVANERFQNALKSFEAYVNEEVLSDSISYVSTAENDMEVEGHEISVSIIKK